MRTAKPLILVTAAKETDTETGLDIVRLHKNYVDSVLQAGGIPLLPAYGGEEAERLAVMADGLLLTGGRDVEPTRMGCRKAETCGPTDSWRDEQEWSFIDAFIRLKKPVLGICRGLQVINVFFGGNLYQDLPSELGVIHRDVMHQVDVRPGSVLETMFGTSFLVNSYHHQSVSALGCGLEAIAWSDGIIEGIQHKELPVFAVQWHPERMAGLERFDQEGPDMAPLFSWWIANI